MGIIRTAEFRAEAIRIALTSGLTQQQVADDRGIGLQFIQLEKPQQNAYVERYNRTVRYDWLNQYIFETIEEVQEAATAWLWTYNNERPNMAIGGITPKQKLTMGMRMAV
jgi:putative transposase